MNKKLLLPVVSLILLATKMYTGYEFTDQNVDQIVDGVLALITLFGHFMEPKKKKG